MSRSSAFVTKERRRSNLLRFFAMIIISIEAVRFGVLGMNFFGYDFLLVFLVGFILYCSRQYNNIDHEIKARREARINGPTS